MNHTIYTITTNLTQYGNPSTITQQDILLEAMLKWCSAYNQNLAFILGLMFFFNTLAIFVKPEHYWLKHLTILNWGLTALLLAVQVMSL